jgi:predicted nucleic acid-binding protein
MDMGFLELLPLAGHAAKAIASLMKRYESIRPQLADASLVYIAGREQIETIFTLDEPDFPLNRTGLKRSFCILPEI